MNPKQVIPTLKKHILVDGFHIVVDLEKSQDSWIIDAATNKKYLDCYSQFASQALGWNHSKLNAHANELGKLSVHKLANSDMYSEQYADFVEEFASVTPDFEHYFFVDGGALAVENALKAAFDWKAKKMKLKVDKLANKLNVIHLKEAFHGRTGYTMSLTNTGELKTKFFPKFDWTRIVNPKVKFPVYDVGANNLEQFSIKEAEAALAKGNVAAIILEPIQGEGGDNHFRISYFKMLRELADRYDAMLILDEVQTGLGLTGKWWAYEHYGIVPDMICFGKKTQVCGFAATNRIDEVKDNVFNVSGRINSTWGGNFIDMVRAAHIIRIIKEDELVANADTVGDYFLQELQKLDIANVRGKGLMIAFDLETEARRDEVMVKLKEDMMALKSGFRSIRFRPHLTFTKKDVNAAIAFIEKAIK